MGAVGPWQIAIVVLVILIIFGAGRLGKIGKGLGEGIRDFKRGIMNDDVKAAHKQLKGTTDAVHDVTAAARKKTV